VSRATVISALGATALLGGWAGYVWHRQRAVAPRAPFDRAQRIEDSTVIPLITPEIDISTAEYVLSRVERMPADEVTVVLHTNGGGVTACVMIADALRQFPRSTAIVPYMAISGGTLIALNAKTLKMGRNAALSAVDPVIYGQRARHIEKKDKDGVYPLAQEYDTAVSGYLRDTLRDRLGNAPSAVDQAMKLFMGESAPHSWPIKAPQVKSLGLAVEAAAPEWAHFVDGYRQFMPEPSSDIIVRRIVGRGR
jgi:ClpP class serine protease